MMIFFVVHHYQSQLPSFLASSDHISWAQLVLESIKALASRKAIVYQIGKLFRLNKIGKNPHMVSERETLESDCQQMNDIVAALSAADNDSLDSLPSRYIAL